MASSSGAVDELKMGNTPIFATFTAPPRRQNPVQIRSDEDNGAVTQFFLKRQMESLGALGVPGRRTRASWRKFHDGPLVAPRHQRKRRKKAQARAVFLHRGGDHFALILMLRYVSFQHFVRGEHCLLQAYLGVQTPVPPDGSVLKLFDDSGGGVFVFVSSRRERVQFFDDQCVSWRGYKRYLGVKGLDPNRVVVLCLGRERASDGGLRRDFALTLVL